MSFPPEELAKFSESGRTIAAAVGTSVELWARAEAGVILKMWAGRTKVATEIGLTRSGIIRAYRLARRAAGFGADKGKGSTGPGQGSINLGFRGGPDGKVYYRTRKAGLAGGRAGFQDAYGQKFSRGKHIAPKDWGAINTMVSQFRAVVDDFKSRAKKSAGLSRQAVVQIAKDLGINLAGVKGGGAISKAGLAKAEAAIASNGVYYKNGSGEASSAAKSFYLTLICRPPKSGVAPVMDRTLQLIILGRLGYFRRNLEEGTFLSAARAAKAYPYLTVLKNAA